MLELLQRALLTVENALGDFVFWIWDRTDPDRALWTWDEDEELL